MKYNILILGASYGSLFSTKLLMAGHRVSLVCTRITADLINREGTVVRFPIKAARQFFERRCSSCHDDDGTLHQAPLARACLLGDIDSSGCETRGMLLDVF